MPCGTKLEDNPDWDFFLPIVLAYARQRSNARCISTDDQPDHCVCSHGYTGDGNICQGIKLINLAGTQSGNPGFGITFLS